MTISRRQFISALAALGAASSAHAAWYTLGIRTKKERPFSFAVMGDFLASNAKSASIINKAAVRIKDDPDIRFVFALGNLGTAGKLSELNLAKNCLDHLKRPYFVLPGPHDLEPGVPDPYGNFKIAFKHTDWVKHRRGWYFIGLNSCDGGAAEVAISPDRAAWLKRCLAKIGTSHPIALLSHHPFAPGCKERRVKNAEEVLGLFSGYNLKLVASGEYRGNLAEEVGGTLFTTTACCSTTVENEDGKPEKGYRVFHVDADYRVQTEFVAVSA